MKHVGTNRMAIVKDETTVVHPNNDRTWSLNLFRYVDIATNLTASSVGLVDKGLRAWV